MQLNKKVVVITGAAGGIGSAMARRFAKEGAKLVLTDLEGSGVKEVAEDLNGIGLICDVTKEDDIRDVVQKAEETFGPVDMFVSNAGVAFGEGDDAASASNSVWQTSWEVNVMSHVYAARAVLPSMIERGEGYFLNMASAAGLLSQIGDAAYSTTKHAAIGFAESLSITHGKQGIKVSCICPQYVATAMTGYGDGNIENRNPGIITPDEAAEEILKGIEAEIFIIHTHPEVKLFVQRKSEDYDRWLGGMRKLREQMIEAVGSTKLEDMQKFMR